MDGLEWSIEFSAIYESECASKIEVVYISSAVKTDMILTKLYLNASVDSVHTRALKCILYSLLCMVYDGSDLNRAIIYGSV